MQVRVPQRFVIARDRLVFGAIGAWAMVLGALLLIDTTANDEVWLPNLWPVLLILGGVATLVFSITLSSFHWRGVSNALLVVACVGRGLAAVVGVLDHSTASWARTLAELGVFTMVGFLLYVVWRSRVPLPGGTRGWLDG